LNVLEVAKRARLAALRMATVSGEARNETMAAGYADLDNFNTTWPLEKVLT
jgi:hypothetical protein